MRYMVTFLTDDEVVTAVPPAQMEGVVNRHDTVTRERQAKGKYVCCARLRPAAEARTIRLVGSRRAVSGGAAGLAGERLSGFYIVESESPEEAVEWAMKLPQLEGVVTEVRLIWEMA
ncbi:MAG: YciI family protein [Candidatus Rokuibacteriota bacterium]